MALVAAVAAPSPLREPRSRTRCRHEEGEEVGHWLQLLRARAETSGTTLGSCGHAGAERKQRNTAPGGRCVDGASAVFPPGSDVCTNPGTVSFRDGGIALAPWNVIRSLVSASYAGDSHS
ncbi:hypothetical protein MRX96_001878 [Rhipicephalus microplus]